MTISTSQAAASDPGTPDGAPRRGRLGRPRKAGVEERVLRATLQLLAERGLAGTTTNEVIRRSGVARATVYLRWPTHRALLVDAVRMAIGSAPIVASGDLEVDLRRGVELSRMALASAEFRSVLPAMVGAFMPTASEPEAVPYAELLPGRDVIAREYGELAAAAGMRSDIEGGIVEDLLMGGLLNRTLATGRGPTREEARQMLDVVLAGVRRSDRAG